MQCTVGRTQNMFHFLFLIFCASPGLGMPNTIQESKYIIGGQDVKIAEVPYTAVLFCKNTFICGATIVSKKYLLSAAHCFMNGCEYSVRVGSSYKEKGGVVYKVKKMVIHPLYSPYAVDYDVSYLEVEDQIEFNSEVQPIPVTDVEPKGGEVAKISGYGRNDYVTYPKQLQSVELPVLDRETCRETHYQLTPRMFCTLSKNRDKCPYKGDSGGPIVVNGKVTGSVSWGRPGIRPCIFPSVYASFADPEIRKFIKENTGV